MQDLFSHPFPFITPKSHTFHSHRGSSQATHTVHNGHNGRDRQYNGQQELVLVRVRVRGSRPARSPFGGGVLVHFLTHVLVFKLKLGEFGHVCKFDEREMCRFRAMQPIYLPYDVIDVK
jgi:hypothetical protein